ncbi:hypothetical protein OF83DRAFT_1084601 [Amylostereum chailletii]|nr:hypothetical protein OF83DRAFT_1084601 [Amylostereum chailletii]
MAFATIPPMQSLYHPHPAPIFHSSAIDPSRFPTSSLRDIPHTPHDNATPLYDPLGVLPPRQDAHRAIPRPKLSVPREVQRGVLSDGRWTARHPAVDAFLARPMPRALLDPRDRGMMAVFALAALKVAFNPGHSAYDIFWGIEDRRATAEFIDGLVVSRPCPIDTAPLTWLGRWEMLWQLSGRQKEHAKVHGIPAATNAARRMTLRKRKAPASAPATDAAEPETKKARTASGARDTRSSHAAQASASSSPAIVPSALAQVHPAQGTPSPLSSSSRLPSEEPSRAATQIQLPTRGRSQRTKTKSAKARLAEAEAEATPPPPVSTAHVPMAAPASVPERPSARRSVSTSGSSTAVSTTADDGAQGTRPRSGSSSSASTTVDLTAPVPGNEKEKEKQPNEEDILKIIAEADEERDVRSTRARTRAAAAKVSTPAPSVPEEREPDVDQEEAMPEAKPQTQRAPARKRAPKSKARRRR